MQVEWKHQIIGHDEKLYMSIAAVLGGIVSFSLLVWASHSVAFDTAAACLELTSRISALVRSRIKTLPTDALVPFKEAGPVGAGLSIMAALLGEILGPEKREGVFGWELTMCRLGNPSAGLL